MSRPEKCPKCGSPLKKIEAGVSKKTGKPYDAFWACQNYNCKYTWNKGKGGSGGNSSAQTSSQDNDKVVQGLRNIYAEIKKIRKMLQIEHNISRANKEAQEVSEDETDGIPVVEDDLETPFD